MAASTVLVILITILFPPAGVAIVSGCGADLLINIALTILGYIPGHIHAFYVEYVYYSRRDQARQGFPVLNQQAPGVYSERVQTGGQNYGTVVQPGVH
ncbi:plasma membrane proteolipid 3 [Xylariaceae sp. FL1272]|nr:plasma membrane proteolipid 3 [Xylariaceae sp. FL1272]